MVNPLLHELREFEKEWKALWKDSDLDRRRNRRDESIKWKARICADDEKPLVSALCDKGFRGSSVWDLVNTKTPYPELIGTLKEHVGRDYLPPIREGIFRALTVRESGGDVLEILVGEWEKGTDREEKFSRWALANAIAYVAKGTKWLDLIGKLLGDDEYSCEPFVRRLKKSARGKEILVHRMQELA